MAKKNLVIIGFGGMGKWHAKRAVNSDVVNLVGIYDIAPDANAAAAERGIYTYPSLEAVLADGNVNLVTIATPNDTHKDLTIAALAAGKNVICEKPVAMSVAELDEMIAAAKKYNRIFTVHQNRRFDPDFLTIRSIYDENALGEVLAIESRVLGSRGIPGDWRKQKEHGGGMLLDWGVHLIDQALQMVDAKIKRIYATFSHATNAEVDDGFLLDLFFANGIRYHVEVGTNHFISMPRWYVVGRDGAARLESWHAPAEVVTCTRWHEDNVTPVNTGAGLTKTMAPRTETSLSTTEVPQPTSDVHAFYRNVCAAIDGTETQMVTHAEVRRVFAVMEAAIESDRIGAPVPFEL